MCQAISEGGLRCASHTRPGYISAMKAVVDGDELTIPEVSILYTTATAYASTPTGLKAVLADMQLYRTSRNYEVADILRISAEEGQRHYEAAKEATAMIEQEKLRGEVTAWAANVPSAPIATKEYVKLLASDLGVEEKEAVELIERLQADATNGILEKAKEWDKIRFLTMGADGRVVGTSSDSTVLDAVAEAERLAGEARRIRRSHKEPVEADGTRWVQYENEALSEIVRAVQYDKETCIARITLAPKGGDLVQYTYTEVTQSIMRSLVSSRSMGAFYAYVFAPLPNGGSLGNKTTRQYSYAAHAANKMFPIKASLGPVPRKYLKDFGFGNTAKKAVAKKATEKTIVVKKVVEKKPVAKKAIAKKTTTKKTTTKKTVKA